MSLRKIWFSWALLTSFFFGMYFFRVAPSAISEYLMPHFKISLPQIGLMTSCFFLTYTISQVPVGYALGRFSVKNLILMAIVACAVTIHLFIQAPSFPIACLAIIVSASFASFGFVGAVSYAGAMFPPHLLPLAVSLTQTAGMLGGFIGKNIVTSLTIHYSWSTALYAVSALLLFLAVLIAIFVPQTPVPKESVQDATGNLDKKAKASLYRQPKTWFNALYAGLVFFPMYSFAESIGEPMLSTIHEMSLSSIAFAISMAYVGWIVGGPLAGLAADIFGRRPVMQFSALSGVVFTAIIILLPMSFVPLCVALFAYGFTNTGLSACYTVASEMYSSKDSSVSVAIANMFTNVFGALFIPVLSKVLSIFFAPQMIDGLPRFAPASYQTVFIVLAIAPALAFICTFFIPETMQRGARK